MSSNFPSQPSVNPISNSIMTQNQLIDSLTSHISLYHYHSLPPKFNSNSNSRSTILKWFSSLTVPQRQAHLTTVDFKFVQILIQMLGKVRTRGHGCFIVLPDLPSRDPPYLPSICFKKSTGLLARVAESNQSENMIFKSSRLFGSKEGENLEDCPCSVRNIDSLTVTEEFVENVDRFVEVMDRVSSEGFLRGEEGELGSEWIELNWLKAKGYYSIEAFVANRLEVALRLSWLNCNNIKKRGVKLKEKTSTAGVAANVFWRKKGSVDWWDKLDVPLKRKVWTAFLGKSSKTLTLNIVKWANSPIGDEMLILHPGRESILGYNYTVSTQKTNLRLSDDSEMGLNIIPASCSGKSTSITDIFKSLLVLQDIITMFYNDYDSPKILYSSFCSICTISDCVLRKLREFLMVTSLDCTKLELLGEGNNKSLPNKSKDKVSASSHRKKGRTRNQKRQTFVSRSCVDDLSCDKSREVLNCSLAGERKEDLMESTFVSRGKDICREEHVSGIATEKVQASTVRKNRKKKHKSKTSKSATTPSSSSHSSHDQAAKFEQVFDKSFNSSISNAKSADSILVSNKISGENDSTQSIEGNKVSHSTESFSQIDPGHSRFSDIMIDNDYLSSGIETLNGMIQCNAIPPPVPALELNNNFCNEAVSIKCSVLASDSGLKSSLLDKPPRTFDVKEESFLTRGRYSGNIRDVGHFGSLKCSPYEWPSVAPFYFPSFNSHLPPATDRLHLDVGHNWHSHFRQSFAPAVRQARNSSIEGGCNTIPTRPLPMSLDWPPVFRSACRLASSITCNYDSGFISRRQSTLQQGFATHGVQTEDEKKCSGDLTDLYESSNKQDLFDEFDGHWISEEEVEVHAVSGIDYNQYFGGGVMYWNPSDHLGTGFSRPPSLSSDDSSWAWREADMNRAVDDMVAFSSSYSTNGLASPTAASFCSPFDPLGSGHQAVGYVMPGNEVPKQVLHSPTTLSDTVAGEKVSGSLTNMPGDVEGMGGDSLSYPILRPIIIPSMSRERSGSELKKRNQDHRSPHIPSTRREQPRLKRPPSPVVLSVPRAPRPPPPSPVGDSRKHRGFPTVRSGSSSPRHWGMKGWYHDGTNSEEACSRKDGAEVVWPSWRNNSHTNRPITQPLSSALLQDRLMAMSQLTRDQEHPDVAFPLQPPELQICPTRKESITLLQSLLHDEIDSFCKHVAAENMAKKCYITWAVKRVTRSLQVLWPRSRTNIFGSNATGLSLPSSDVDLVVCLPPVRNLEPIKEAGILEGRNGIKETCLQHAARYLANQEWVKNDSLKIVENTAIPIIMLVVEVPNALITSSTSNVQSPKDETSTATAVTLDSIHSEMVGLEDDALPKCTQINYDSTKDSKSVRLDISFKTPSHTGLQTTELVKQLTEQFPAVKPLALVLKQFLADRSLDQSYSGGLSSYCLVLLITRFLQHEHHLGRPINQNFGSLLVDFLYFFGNVFDPRQMRISIQGSGVYIKRERGCSIDPIHVDDPLFPMNNVGRNCFRIHQCIKAFSDALSILEAELTCLSHDGNTYPESAYRLLQKIIPSIDLSELIRTHAE